MKKDNVEFKLNPYHIKMCHIKQRNVQSLFISLLKRSKSQITYLNLLSKEALSYNN